ncbi:hypothetical protein SY83_09280 [Paenibacillus swuensis]|uniref:HTH araC/xylS-type domain-containing protein n=1 Tax=Paenibacillus swuensis TaxID=1178515 RepID=A0A172TI23_9BACL|nr:AraC family transcriptional regulator [Paenibacillus swuensis]ANE46433.1 hypothetical protein SY83_09280 [Paenibacillus swuensis]
MMEPVSYNLRNPSWPAGWMQLEYMGYAEERCGTYQWDGLLRKDRSVVFQYTLSGQGKLEKDGVVRTINPGEAMMLIFPERVKYYVDLDTSDHWSFLWLQASGADAYRYWIRFIREWGHIVTLPLDSEPILRMKEMLAELSLGEKKDPYALSCSLYEWILLLLRQSQPAGHNEHFPSHESGQDSVDLLKQYIDIHYTDPRLCLDSMAEVAHLSKVYMCQMFKKRFGIAPMSYVQQLKLAQAARALVEEERQVSEVAVTSGFENASYFGKAFRARFGMTPTAYRMSRVHSAADGAFPQVIQR